jgi:large subunit ribosomal protein L3
VLPEESLILIRGGVPGPRNAMVVVRGAIKRAGGVVKAKPQPTGKQKK